MACARRQDRNIPSLDFDFTTSGPAQHQRGRTASKPEHLMGGRMIVMEGINAISPLRRPAGALEERLERRGGFFATVRCNHSPVQQDRKNRVVWNPVVRGQEKGFRCHGRSSIFTERSYARE